MSFRPYSTLLVGIVIGVFVVPRVARAANFSIPGA